MNLPRCTAALVLVAALGLTACSGAEDTRDSAGSAASSLASPSADLGRGTATPESLASEAAVVTASADPDVATTEGAPAGSAPTGSASTGSAPQPAAPSSAAPKPAAPAPAPAPARTTPTSTAPAAPAPAAPQESASTAPQPAASSSSPSSSPPPPTAAPPSPAPTRLLGFVGTRENPNAYEIGLTDAAGRSVTSVPAGTYTFTISDRSTIHNFRLRGPGVSKATSVSQTEEVTFTVELVAGTYSYVCDPHGSMNGSLTVTP